MEKKVKVPYQGRQVDGLEMEFKTKKEEWNEYEISDGSTLRLKPVIISIVKIDEYDPDGNPVYMAKATNVVSISAPENLRKGTRVS